MEAIQPIIDVLDRDNALQLDNEERSYTEEQEPVSVEWDQLFPGAAGKRGDQDWEIFEDPWEEDLPNEVVEEIKHHAESPGDWSNVLPVEYPEDVVGTEGSIWDICAWYQPIHYFGFDWGIYIREDCLIKHALKIASQLQLEKGTVGNPRLLAKAVIRASFASFFLHEHFHHKVESLGLRLHVVMGKSAYLLYKRGVYCPNYLTDKCLEEALANADAFNRLATQPYGRLMGKSVADAARRHMKNTFNTDPPGYRKAVDYLSRSKFDAGARLLQGQVKEALLNPKQAVTDWSAAKQLLRSYFSLRSDIYTVVKRGTRSILPTRIFPKTCSTADMVKVYESKGYSVVSGGKGSHIKLKKTGAPTMHLPGNRKELSPGVLNSALKTLGGYSTHELERLIRAA